ncbi:MAG: ATP-binding protein [Betaproteobacteria bacterium]
MKTEDTRGPERGRERWRRRWRDSELEGVAERAPAPPRARRGAPRADDTPAGWHQRQRHYWRHRHHLRRHYDISLGKRLLATFIVASGLSLLLAAVLLKILFVWFPAYGMAHGMGDQARWIEQHLEYDAAGRPVALREPADTAWVYTAATRDLKFRVLDDHGALLLAADPAALPLAPAGSAFDAAREDFDMVDAGLPVHVATRAFEHGGRRLFVQVAVSERAAALFRGSVVGPVLKYAMLVALVSLVLFSIGIHASLGRLLRPLRLASAAAARIAPRNLETRLSPARMPRELRPLIRAFNLALDRLEQGYRVQQEFLASAAHELKTPLALIRGQVELSDLEDRDLLLADIDRMARQVHQLLHLAEVSEAGNYEFEPVDLAAAAGEATAFLQRLAQRAGVHLELRAPQALAPRRADRGAVFVLLKNLVENAIQHSPQGACVTIALDAAGLALRDEGEGIAPEHLPDLFKRFWRGPARRDSGAGLGLAICHEIATAHGWSLHARNGVGGAEFVLAFDGSNPLASVS